MTQLLNGLSTEVVRELLGDIEGLTLEDIETGTNLSAPSASIETPTEGEIEDAIAELDAQGIDTTASSFSLQVITTLDGNDNFFIGSFFDDVVFAQGGNDTVAGGFGFNNAALFDGNDIIFGGAGRDFFVAGTGDDLYFGDSGNDALTYNQIDVPIILEALGSITKVGVVDGEGAVVNGTDSIQDIEIITGSTTEFNAIDGRVAGGNPEDVTFDIDLEQESLNITGVPTGVDQGEIITETIEFSVRNFFDVIGTSNDDEIDGNLEDNIISGGEGSDFIDGKEGNDVLIGVEADLATITGAGNLGTGDTDVLTGGINGTASDPAFGLRGDLFVLGDFDNFYYAGDGQAQILDFETGIDQIVLSGSETDYDFVPSFGTTFIAFTGTQDLVATVTGTVDLVNDDVFFTNENNPLDIPNRTAFAEAALVDGLA